MDLECHTVRAPTQKGIVFQLPHEQVFENLERRLRGLSDSGGTILGYVYPHTPLELLLAHGVTPSLIWANPEVQGGFEGSLQTFSCSFTRNLFSQRSNGDLSSLSGFLFPNNTCDSLHNVADVWRRRFPEDKLLRLTYPAARFDEDSIQFFAEELRILSKSLEATYGRYLSSDALLAAVSLVNNFRDAAQALYSCRIMDPSLVSYSEVLRMVREFLTNPAADAVDQIREYAGAALQVLQKRGHLNTVKSLQKELLSGKLSDLNIVLESKIPRVLIVGGMVEPLVVVSLFKGSASPGQEVVALDLFSFGFKTVFTPPVSLNGDPFVSIAKSILGAPTEPTQEGLPRRLEFLKAVLSRLSIDGLVICEQSFCEPDQFESPSLVKAASEVNVPSVRLPIDPELSDRNRLEGRVQSFLETLEGGTRRND